MRDHSAPQTPMVPAAAFLAGGRFVGLAALLSVAGVGAFLSRVAWMLRQRRPAPRELRRPDWSVGLCLAVLTGGLNVLLVLRRL